MNYRSKGEQSGYKDHTPGQSVFAPSRLFFYHHAIAGRRDYALPRRGLVLPAQEVFGEVEVQGGCHF